MSQYIIGRNFDSRNFLWKNRTMRGSVTVFKIMDSSWLLNYLRFFKFEKNLILRELMKINKQRAMSNNEGNEQNFLPKTRVVHIANN